MWTGFISLFKGTYENEHYSNTCADSLESTFWIWIHTEISQLLYCFLLRTLSNLVQVIFQYRRLNHCRLLLVASHFSGRAKPLGNCLVQGFLSVRSLGGQMLVCHLFLELTSHGNLQEQQGQAGTAQVLPCSPLNSPWAKPMMVRGDLGKTHIREHTNGYTAWMATKHWPNPSLCRLFWGIYAILKPQLISRWCRR